MFPSYKGPQNEYAGHLPNGTRVEGIWGAMYASDEGTIIGYSASQGHLIDWDEGSQVGTEGPTYYQVRLTRSVNGSSIGVWQTPS